MKRCGRERRTEGGVKAEEGGWRTKQEEFDIIVGLLSIFSNLFIDFGGAGRLGDPSTAEHQKGEGRGEINGHTRPWTRKEEIN